MQSALNTFIRKATTFIKPKPVPNKQQIKLNKFIQKANSVVNQNCDLLMICKNQISLFKQLENKFNAFEETANLRDIAESLCTIQDYENYMNHIALFPNITVPPTTIGIEFFWRTHLLNPRYYYDDCMNLCDKVIPHHIKSAEFETTLNIPTINNKTAIKFVNTIDLISAVERQLNFAKKMHNINEKNEIDDKQLQIAIDRYYHFMYLVFHKQAKQMDILVPSIDVDFVWHSHQLIPTEYKQFCNEFGKHIIDHNDNLEEEFLRKKEQETADFWNNVYFADAMSMPMHYRDHAFIANNESVQGLQGDHMTAECGTVLADGDASGGSSCGAGCGGGCGGGGG